MFWRGLFAMGGICVVNNVGTNIPHRRKITSAKTAGLVNENQKIRVDFINPRVDRLSMSNPG